MVLKPVQGRFLQRRMTTIPCKKSESWIIRLKPFLTGQEQRQGAKAVATGSPNAIGLPRLRGPRWWMATECKQQGKHRYKMRVRRCKMEVQQFKTKLWC